MLKLDDIKGVIFDLDETMLLTNDPADLTNGLHERARLIAVHEAGRKYDIARLTTITPQENWDMFAYAPTHTLDSAVWRTLLLAGVVNDPDIDYNHALLQEIRDRKNELYSDLLRAHGREVPGISPFVHGLGAAGLHDHLAIASSSYRPHIDIFLKDITGLDRFFPDHRIVSRERVVNPKPHPEPFDMAFRSFKLPEQHRSHVVAFEDSKGGIASAKAAGLFTCAVTTWMTAEELRALAVPPDYIFDDYLELAELLGLATILNDDA